jgi:hypothetical protein
MHGNGWKRALFAREHIVGSCLHQQRQRKGHRESLPIGDGTGRDGAVLGWDGTGWVVTDIYIGYLIQGIGRLGPGRARGERGLRHVVGRVSNPNVPCGSSLVPCVPRGARLVCWRLLCWRQLRLPLSGYRGAFLRPSILLTKALVQTWSKVWPLVVV